MQVRLYQSQNFQNLKRRSSNEDSLTGVYTEQFAKWQAVLETSARAHFEEADHHFYKYEELPKEWIRDYPRIEQKVYSVRPKIVLETLNRGYDYVFFLGSDIEFFDRPTSMLLGHQDVALTPHLLEPLPEDKKHPSMEDILRAGFFNSDSCAGVTLPLHISFYNGSTIIWKTSVSLREMYFMTRPGSISLLPFVRYVPFVT